MIAQRVYDASLPMFAAWSLESPLFTAVVFVQSVGNETRVIESMKWKLKALHECLADVEELLAKRRYRIREHVTPPDPDLIYWQQFVDRGHACSAAPKLSDEIAVARRMFATLRIEATLNEDLIDALNQYAPREDGGNYIITDGHKPERFFVRALEIFAAWRHKGGGVPEQWGPAPDYTLADRARI